MKSFLRYLKSLSIYKKAFWLYLFLLFVEGAMRKWFMPGMSNIWMISREPIVIYLVFVGLNKGWLRSKVALTFMLIGCIMFITTLIWGHQDIYVDIYGFRIWFFHIPFIFVVSHILNREDLIWILKLLVIIFIPMTVLYLLQWSAPGNHILNAYVGGEIADQEKVAYGAVRPNGTFGALGSSYYNPIVFALFCICAISQFYRRKFWPFRWGFIIFTVAIIVMLITSVSRGTIIQSVLTFIIIALFGGQLNDKKIFTNILIGVLVVGLSFSILSKMSFKGKKLMAPVTERFKAASNVEGGASGIVDTRVLYAFKWYATPNQYNDKYNPYTTPLTGYGLGLSSNYGTQRLTSSETWALGEYPSIQITQEMGIFFGTIVFFLRLGLPIYLFFPCVRILRRHKDLLPFSLWTLSIPYFCNGNINITTSLGFIVLTMILLLVSIKTSAHTSQQ